MLDAALVPLVGVPERRSGRSPESHGTGRDTRERNV